MPLYIGNPAHFEGGAPPSWLDHPGLSLRRHAHPGLISLVLSFAVSVCSSWLLPAPPCFSWLLVAPSASFWLLLAGSFWFLLAPPGSLILAHPGPSCFLNSGISGLFLAPPGSSILIPPGSPMHIRQGRDREDQGGRIRRASWFLLAPPRSSILDPHGSQEESGGAMQVRSQGAKRPYLYMHPPPGPHGALVS